MNREQLEGKTILVGLTYYDEQGEVLEQTQFHGEILEAHESNGVRIHDQRAQSERTMPPRLDAIFPAPPGTYREYSTQESVENPDFIAMWHITKVKESEDDWEWVPTELDHLMDSFEREPKNVPNK